MRLPINITVFVGRTSDTRVRVVTRGTRFYTLLMLLFFFSVLSTDVCCT